MLTKPEILEHYGLDETDDMDRYVDWEALARSLENPTRWAVCHILDKNGKIVMSEGCPVRVHQEVAVKDYRQELESRSLRFIGWF